MLADSILPRALPASPEIFAQIMLESSKRISACKGFGISVSSMFAL
jgi:hypothetical protein